MTAPAAAPTARKSLVQTVDVETPELVVFSYTIAGVGSRASAALIDALICVAGFLLLVIGLYQLTRFGPTATPTIAGAVARSTAWAAALVGIFQFAVLWLYYVLFEALADGQTPGKRMMGLRVVRDGGLSVTFEASAIRNLVRIVDMQPVALYAVGMVSIVANARGKRLGDLVAGTIVVKEDLLSRPMTVAPPPRVTRDTDPAPLLSARLTDAEYQVLDRFVERRMELEPDRRAVLGRTLAERFSHVLEQAPEQLPIAQLVDLHHHERSARARGMAARSDTGAARERHAIIATNAPRWTAFAMRLKTAQRGGLRKRSESEVREFVQEYRELTSDLARLRTATRGTESAELFYLNRLVASAHSLLYRRKTLTMQRVVNFLFADVPAEVRRSFVPILLAATMLFGPMLIAARSVVLHPELAAQLLPPAMLERAEDGMTAAKRGKGYIEDPQMLRPFFASRIITNNVQVSFFAFALGITAGILTTVVLVTNGISIGAMFGLYVSKGIGSLLLAFVAPHGVLELTAITFAGAAGLIIGAAILIPGERTRRKALAENGRRAIRLVGGAAFLLVFAGTLEGFISPIPDWPLRDKLLVSAATAVLLAMYLRPWTWFARAAKPRPAETVATVPRGT